MKVQLRKNLRYFDHDDSDFLIQGNEIKELPIKHLRSYSIKHYLFTGKLKVVEGDVLVNVKQALVYINPEGLWAKEYGKYFTKDLELDTVTWIDDDRVPIEIFAKLNEIKLQEPEEEPEEEPDISKMTKDQLNDYAAKKGFGEEIHSSMLKRTMFRKLKKLLK